MEYAIYPFKDIRITQRHDEGNHRPHNIPFIDHIDKPWDEACTDSGRQYFEPQNDYKVVEVMGVGNATTNSVRLETVNKVKIPYQDELVILELTLTHMNDADLKNIKVGQILKKGGKYLLEGKDGATAYHFHCTANIGKYYGFKKNANGSWCFVYEKSLLPNEAFYINPKWNKVINSNGYAFQNVPDDAPTKIKKITANIRKELDEIDKLLEG